MITFFIAAADDIRVTPTALTFCVIRRTVENPESFSAYSFRLLLSSEEADALHGAAGGGP
jgi:hypothetical protein